ncbi:hypothetical protein DPMN_079714 [Dreissena polymorpha]|uniref:Uncharacterized protein n=1 Tax=Dreissena polymorpha TaxID=45954 RepID=A0A9D4BIL1_DREPO|nr:hypothetical protein DPMN_079714 [Dreissena polymorpha]
MPMTMRLEWTRARRVIAYLSTQAYFCKSPCETLQAATRLFPLGQIVSKVYTTSVLSGLPIRANIWTYHF